MSHTHTHTHTNKERKLSCTQFGTCLAEVESKQSFTGQKEGFQSEGVVWRFWHNLYPRSLCGSFPTLSLAMTHPLNILASWSRNLVSKVETHTHREASPFQVVWDGRSAVKCCSTSAMAPGGLFCFSLLAVVSDVNYCFKPQVIDVTELHWCLFKLSE